MTTGPQIRHYFTKIVGVSYPATSGGSRQANLAACRLWEPLVLEGDRDTPHGPAVRVLRQGGEELGHLPAEQAEEVIGRSERGWRYGVYIANLTGGTARKPHRGANLLVVVAPPGVGDADAQAYVDALKASGELDLEAQARPHERAAVRRSGCLAVLVVLALVAASVVWLH